MVMGMSKGRGKVRSWSTQRATVTKAVKANMNARPAKPDMIAKESVNVSGREWKQK